MSDSNNVDLNRTKCIPSVRSPVAVSSAPILLASSELDQDASNLLSSKSPVTPGPNAVCSYYSAITPPPDGIDMHVKQVSYLACFQHIAHMFMMYHIPLPPHFNYPNTTIAYPNSSDNHANV